MKKIFFSIGISIIIMYCFGSPSHAVEQVAGADSLASDSLKTINDSLAYTADSVFYDTVRDVFQLSGNATIIYHNSTINADSLVLDNKKNQAFSVGNIMMKDGDQKLIGDAVSYDFDKQWGIIKYGAGKFEKGFYYGEEIRKVDENIFDISKGSFTTSDALYPMFWMEAKKMRLYKNDKVVARPLIFYVNHFPVFGLPFGAFSIKRGRKAGFLTPSPGYNSSDGKTIEDIAYYYPYKEYADLTLAFDYKEKKGWETRFINNYKVRYQMYGLTNLRFQRVILAPNEYKNEWSFVQRHHHDLANKSTLDLNLHFASSTRVYAGDIDIDDRTNKEISSSFAYKRPLWGRSLSLTGSYKENLISKQRNITLPRLLYSAPSVPFAEMFDSNDNDVWYNNFSYKYRLSAIHTGIIKDKSPSISQILYKSKTDSLGSEHRGGIKHTTGLSWSKKIGVFNLSQSFGYNEVWWDKDKDNNEYVRGYDWRTNSALSFNINGIAVFGDSYVRAIRHIVTPKVSFSYVPNSKRNQKFTSFGGISLASSKQARRVNFALSNKWQLKIRDGGNDKKLNSFFSIDSSINYDLEKDEKYFSDLASRLRMDPGKLTTWGINYTLATSSSITQDPYNARIKRWSIAQTIKFSGKRAYIDYFPIPLNKFASTKFFGSDSLTTNKRGNKLADLDKLAKDESWSFSSSFDYSHNRLTDAKRVSIKPRISLKLTKFWEVSYNNYVNLKEKDIISHNLDLSRDLHSWKLDFSWYKSGNYWSFYIKLFNVKLPDALKIKKREYSNN